MFLVSFGRCFRLHIAPSVSVLSLPLSLSYLLYILIENISNGHRSFLCCLNHSTHSLDSAAAILYANYTFYVRILMSDVAYWYCYVLML